MTVVDSPEWLPPDWTVEVKTRKTGATAGNKDVYYTNPATGCKFRTKDEVIRFLKAGKHQSLTSQGSQPLKRRMRMCSGDNKMADLPKWLPTGWNMEIKFRKSGTKAGTKYKCYVAPMTGCKFYSKGEVFRYLKSEKIGSRASKTKKISINSNSTNNVVAQIEYSPDSLPPGWTKEIKFRKRPSSNEFRRDPYYTDPVTGYIFRSKKEVFRYLQTGELGKHAYRPKKRSPDDAQIIDNEFSPPNAAKRQKLPKTTARRRLFKSRSLNSNGTASEQIGESPSKQQCIDQTSNQGVTDPSNSVPPKAKPSKKKRKGKISQPKNQLGSTQLSTELSKDDQLPKNGPEKHETQNARLGSTKSKAIKTIIFPRRASKRLAGLEAELTPDFSKGDRAHLAAGRQSANHDELKTEPVLESGPNDSASDKPLRDQTTQEELKGEVENPPGDQPMPGPKGEGEDPLGDQAMTAEPNKKVDKEKTADEKLDFPSVFPFGDSWPDPCLEFAFKTLTGAIPVGENNVEITDYFQPQIDVPQTQIPGALDLPDFGSDALREAELMFQFDSPEKPTLSPGNGGLPCYLENEMQSSGKVKEIPGTKINN